MYPGYFEPDWTLEFPDPADQAEEASGRLRNRDIDRDTDRDIESDEDEDDSS